MTAYRLSALTAVLASLLSVTAWGQTRVRQGNVLDANLRVGSGGINNSNRANQGNGANRIVTGNVAGGLSFRGYSPVQDPSSLFIRNYAYPTTTSSGVSSNMALSGLANIRTGLPSDTLTNFNRDSVGVNNVRQGQTLGSLSQLPYYSPSSTVASTGAIVAGLNRPGSSQLISPYTTAQPGLVTPSSNPLLTAGAGRGGALSVSPQLIRIDNGQTLTGPVNERLLGSALFGAVRQVSVDALAAQNLRGSGRALSSDTGNVPRLADRGLERDPARGESASMGGNRPGTERAGIASNANTGNSADMPGDVGTGRLRSANEGPLAGSGELRQPFGATPNPAVAAAQQAIAAAEQNEAARDSGLRGLDLSGPLRTLAGSQIPALNQRLVEAEDLLKRGQYYRAAKTYESARTIDPSNPLPLLGESMALLGAGDYVTSSNYLMLGIRLHDVMSKLQVDLTGLIPDAEILGARRADLEKRLQVFDDFRLRFLLGYLEYSTGHQETGIANMERASAGFPAEMAKVKLFVKALGQASEAKGGSTPATRPAQDR